MSEHTVPHLVSFEIQPDYSSEYGSGPMEHREIDPQLATLCDRVLLVGGKTEEAVN